jgi:hypothetical protein
VKLLSVGTVAEQLGLSHQRVKQLIAQGDLPAQKVAGIWVIDPADVIPVRVRTGAGRPVSPESAWSLLLMSHFTSQAMRDAGDALRPVARARARARSRAHDLSQAVLDQDLEGLVRGLRKFLGNRATRLTYRAAGRDLEDLREDPRLHPSGVSAPSSTVAAGGLVEGYVCYLCVDAIVEDHLLDKVSAASANVILHVPGPEAPPGWEQWLSAPLLLAADLVEHHGARENLEAFRILARTIAAMHPHDPDAQRATAL